jgi:hypothetical protein
MHLISTLASGVNGAASGTAEIYTRGTTTRATYYTDFEGNNAIATGADVSLDANGGATVYVNQYVTITVKDSGGTAVRTFDDGYSANNVEYNGDSFTGVDYDSGASGVNKPVTVTDIFNMWNNSANATDFKVDIDGTATNLNTAVAGWSGVYFNVKSSTYGAVGDGTTDDTAAISAAITAATTNGGIVFFPAATYRITSTLTVPGDVLVQGAGNRQTILLMDHATEDHMTFTQGSTPGTSNRVQDIRFLHNQSSSGAAIELADADVRLLVDNCFFSGANNTGPLINAGTTGAARLTVSNSAFTLGASADQAILSINPTLFVYACVFEHQDTWASDTIKADHACIVSCDFIADGGIGAAGNYLYFDNDADNRYFRVFGCHFRDDSNANVTAFNEADPDHSTCSEGILEMGCTFAMSNPYRQALTSASVTSYLSTQEYQGSRTGKKITNTIASTGAKQFDPRAAEIHQFDMTHTGGTATLDADYVCPEGQRLIVQFISNNATPGVVAFNTDTFSFTPASWTPSARYKARIFEFVSITVPLVADGSKDLKWAMVSDSGEYGS